MLFLKLFATYWVLLLGVRGLHICRFITLLEMAMIIINHEKNKLEDYFDKMVRLLLPLLCTLRAMDSVAHGEMNFKLV